jgi:hypothetical protein
MSPKSSQMSVGSDTGLRTGVHYGPSRASRAGGAREHGRPSLFFLADFVSKRRAAWTPCQRASGSIFTVFDDGVRKKSPFV